MKNLGNIKVTEYFKDFLDNTRATRRSKIIGTDDKMLTYTESCDLIVNYFKANTVAFNELIKFKLNNDVK